MRLSSPFKSDLTPHEKKALSRRSRTIAPGPAGSTTIPSGRERWNGGWVSELLGARRFIKEKNAAGEAEKLRASLFTARRVLLEHQAWHISSGASGAIPRDRSDTHCTCPLPSNGASNLSQTLLINLLIYTHSDFLFKKIS